MRFTGIKARWLTAPLAALFLLFSSGAAAAPECHVESTVLQNNQPGVTHSHAAHSHSHAPQLTAGAFSNSETPLLSVGGTLVNEVCVVVGFIVLLLLRFSSAIRSTLTAKQFSPPRYQLPLFIPKNLGYLNLNHLQLGVIRI